MIFANLFGRLARVEPETDFGGQANYCLALHNKYKQLNIVHKVGTLGRLLKDTAH